MKVYEGKNVTVATTDEIRLYLNRLYGKTYDGVDREQVTVPGRKAFYEERFLDAMIKSIGSGIEELRKETAVEAASLAAKDVADKQQALKQAKNREQDVAALLAELGIQQ